MQSADGSSIAAINGNSFVWVSAGGVAGPTLTKGTQALAIGVLKNLEKRAKK